MRPDGMRSQSGREWDFPGTTHYLGHNSEESPAGWLVIWGEGDWRLWQNLNPTSGTTVRGEQTYDLPRDAVRRLTLNTMEVSVPAGSTAVQIFCNWHRGWKWMDKDSGTWNKAAIGENRTIRIDFKETLARETTLYLRYRPTRPLWVLCVSLISLAVTLAFALFALVRKISKLCPVDSRAV